MIKYSKKRELLKYIGDISQVFSARQFVFSDGKSRGMRGIDVNTGDGLTFTVLPDRGMDIANLSFKGINCSFLSKTGISSPKYHEKDGDNYLRTFYGGFLTTCGLRNFGWECEVDGEVHPMHGRISHTPAENLAVRKTFCDSEPEISMYGEMREVKVFNENLVLKRDIKCGYGKNEIIVNDQVENLGFTKEPLMLLYHINIGYPLLDIGTDINLPKSEIIPKDEISKNELLNHLKITRPNADAKSLIYFHKFEDNEKVHSASVSNKELGIKLEILFNHNQLPRMTQLKHLGESEYMFCIEPANSLPSLENAIDKGTVNYIEPGEVKEFEITIRVSTIE